MNFLIRARRWPGPDRGCGRAAADEVSRGSETIAELEVALDKAEPGRGDELAPSTRWPPRRPRTSGAPQFLVAEHPSGGCALRADGPSRIRIAPRPRNG